MKKSVAIGLCVAAVVAAGLYFLLGDRAAVNPYARFLPPDVVGTVNLTHAGALADGFAASPLGQVLAKDTVHAIVREMGGEPQDIAEYDRVYDSVAAVANDPAFRAVFGDDATLALLPPDRTVLAEKPQEALRDALVVVARTSAASALDMLSRLIKNARIGRETVDGLDLVKITPDKGQVFYGHAEGRMVFLASAPAAIKACLAAGKGEAALDKASAFQAAAAFWKTFPEATTYSRMYVNFPAVAELFKTAAVAELRETGEMLAGVGTMYSISYGTAQGLESRGQAGLTYDQLHPAMQDLLDAAAKGNQSLHLLTEHTLAYNWASSLQAERIMKAMGAADAEEYRKTDAEVRQNLGVSLEELGRAFGPQYGGVLDDIVRTPLFPWPKLTFFVEVRDRTVAETALNGLRRLVAGEGITAEEQEQVAGQTVYSWPVLPGAAQPAAVLAENMLYLSTSKEAIKMMLETKAAPDVLAAPVAAQLGPELAGRMGDANFSDFVVFPARMARQTGETIDWLAAILATSKGTSLERLNRELVQLMRSTELMAGTTRVSRERMEWTLTITRAKNQAAGANGQ
ncbi:DUF3352 domain-containing protein [Desulfobulbus elongatus]|uniref:DUF3352 domain-containing protein n=1 Tax=Desulfobulbus elongatus TaxID=53332 RepID=UPI0004894E6B|nr:DUF3352 domain-containing protein [Desulfobulbus elongatus]